MSGLVDKLKKQLEKDLEREVGARIAPVLDVLKRVLEEQQKTNSLLEQILSELRCKSR